MSNLDLPDGSGPKQTSARMNNRMPTIIRDINVQDAGDVRDIYRHYVLNGLSSFELSPPDEDEIRTRMERIKERGQPVLYPHRPRAAPSGKIYGVGESHSRDGAG